MDTKRRYMMESNILAGNAIIKHIQKKIWLDIKEQYMMESNTLASNAAIKQLQCPILLDIKEQYMKESRVPQILCLAGLKQENTYFFQDQP